jgi:hypothetical protein
MTDEGKQKDYAAQFRKRFTAIPNEVLLDPFLKSSAKVVYIYLLARDYEKSGVSWPGEITVARDTGLCVRTVGAAIAALQQGGYLEVNQWRSTNGTGKWASNMYRLKVTAPKAPQKPKGKRGKYRKAPRWDEMSGGEGPE